MVVGSWLAVICVVESLCGGRIMVVGEQCVRGRRVCVMADHGVLRIFVW